MSIGNAPVCQSSTVISSCVYFNTAFVPAVSNLKAVFRNRGDVLRKNSEICPQNVPLSRDCNSFRRAIWSDPYDECRRLGMRVKRKNGGVSFPAGIFYRFHQHESVSRVALPWKRYSTFLPRGWLARPKFCGLFCFDKRVTNVTGRKMQTINIFFY